MTEEEKTTGLDFRERKKLRTYLTKYPFLIKDISSSKHYPLESFPEELQEYRMLLWRAMVGTAWKKHLGEPMPDALYAPFSLSTQQDFVAKLETAFTERLKTPLTSIAQETFEKLFAIGQEQVEVPENEKRLENKKKRLENKKKQLKKKKKELKIRNIDKEIRNIDKKIIPIKISVLNLLRKTVGLENVKAKSLKKWTENFIKELNRNPGEQKPSQPLQGKISDTSLNNLYEAMKTAVSVYIDGKNLMTSEEKETGLDYREQEELEAYKTKLSSEMTKEDYERYGQLLWRTQVKKAWETLGENPRYLYETADIPAIAATLAEKLPQLLQTRHINFDKEKYRALQTLQELLLFQQNLHADDSADEEDSLFQSTSSQVDFHAFSSEDDVSLEDQPSHFAFIEEIEKKQERWQQLEQQWDDHPETMEPKALNELYTLEYNYLQNLQTQQKKWLEGTRTRLLQNWTKKTIPSWEALLGAQQEKLQELISAERTGKQELSQQQELISAERTGEKVQQNLYQTLRKLVWKKIRNRVYYTLYKLLRKISQKRRYPSLYNLSRENFQKRRYPNLYNLPRENFQKSISAEQTGENFQQPIPTVALPELTRENLEKLPALTPHDIAIITTEQRLRQVAKALYKQRDSEQQEPLSDDPSVKQRLQVLEQRILGKHHTGEPGEPGEPVEVRLTRLERHRSPYYVLDPGPLPGEAGEEDLLTTDTRSSTDEKDLAHTHDLFEEGRKESVYDDSDEPPGPKNTIEERLTRLESSPNGEEAVKTVMKELREKKDKNTGEEWDEITEKEEWDEITEKEKWDKITEEEKKIREQTHAKQWENREKETIAQIKHHRAHPEKTRKADWGHVNIDGKSMLLDYYLKIWQKEEQGAFSIKELQNVSTSIREVLEKRDTENILSKLPLETIWEQRNANPVEFQKRENDTDNNFKERTKTHFTTLLEHLRGSYQHYTEQVDVITNAIKNDLKLENETGEKQIREIICETEGKAILTKLPRKAIERLLTEAKPANEFVTPQEYVTAFYAFCKGRQKRYLTNRGAIGEHFYTKKYLFGIPRLQEKNRIEKIITDALDRIDTPRLLSELSKKEIKELLATWPLPEKSQDIQQQHVQKFYDYCRRYILIKEHCITEAVALLEKHQKPIQKAVTEVLSEQRETVLGRSVTDLREFLQHRSGVKEEALALEQIKEYVQDLCIDYQQFIQVGGSYQQFSESKKAWEDYFDKHYANTFDTEGKAARLKALKLEPSGRFNSVKKARYALPRTTSHLSPFAERTSAGPEEKDRIKEAVKREFTVLIAQGREKNKKTLTEALQTVQARQAYINSLRKKPSLANYEDNELYQCLKDHFRSIPAPKNSPFRKILVPIRNTNSEAPELLKEIQEIKTVELAKTGVEDSYGKNYTAVFQQRYHACCKKSSLLSTTNINTLKALHEISMELELQKTLIKEHGELAQEARQSIQTLEKDFNKKLEALETLESKTISAILYRSPLILDTLKRHRSGGHQQSTGKFVVASMLSRRSSVSTERSGGFAFHKTTQSRNKKTVPEKKLKRRRWF